MEYWVVIHKDPGSCYGVTVPDLPGCFSAGDTFEEALDMAREAIEFFIDGLLEDGESIPEVRPIEEHIHDPYYADGIWTEVAVADPRLEPVGGG